MSHYTIGMRSTPGVRGIADRANRKRSAALKYALVTVGRAVSHGLAQVGRPHRTAL